MRLDGTLAEAGLKPFIEETFEMGAHKLPKVWVVVIDAQKAHFFRKPDGGLEKIGEALPDKNAVSEITNETSGRMQASGSGGRHRLEAHDEALRHESEAFMKSLADLLHEAASKHAFDRLVLVATPRMLGMLRPLLHKDVDMRINAEIDKDLTHLDERELCHYLDETLWASRLTH